MRLAARRDSNEDELVSVAEKLGARFVYAGPLDFWLWSPKTGWIPVECKSKRGKLTKAQVKFTNQCLADGAPYLIWKTEGDVLQAVQALQTA